MTNDKCGKCRNFAKSNMSETVGACMARTVGVDYYIRRHVGDRACLLYREKEAQDGRG